ncbi:gibberellin 2-beta-dioxygenase 2-like [Ananas comosus]|uniref:gibberellin 2beta-dioxygenase n=1 Tax=Ananas comosus TaxID=4615 RepID=A0A6P5ETN6_ANACO|nr:gibberellin 2-beta-dioxygenase 2-like [Ananas comosus]
MVVASASPLIHDKVIQSFFIPVIDLSQQRSLRTELVVKSCEKLGFFKVINHGVPLNLSLKMEAAAVEFFALPGGEKQRAGPSSPLGYGSKSIGLKGDTGEVEYLLLPANPSSLSHRAWTISREGPEKFSCAANKYVEAVRKLACEILELLGEGLGLKDTEVFSRMIRDRESDSLLRLNHYLPCSSREENDKNRVGFGEHTDPQIITLLRSNGVEGLQILPPFSSGEAAWFPVSPDPTAFFVLVGDALQAMTNGRLVSVRHRAIVHPYSSRLSMVYFAAPSLHSCLAPIPEMVTVQRPRCYKSFTWGDYKKAMYSLRLGHNRLDLFRVDANEDNIKPLI